MVAAIIIIIIFTVSIALVSGWGASAGGMIDGIVEFFSSIMAGKTVPNGGIPQP
jgi:hypothetical protein